MRETVSRMSGGRSSRRSTLKRMDGLPAGNGCLSPCRFCGEDFQTGERALLVVESEVETDRETGFPTLGDQGEVLLHHPRCSQLYLFGDEEELRREARREAERDVGEAFHSMLDTPFLGDRDVPDTRTYRGR